MWPLKRNYKWDRNLNNTFPSTAKKSKNKNSNQVFFWLRIWVVKVKFIYETFKKYLFENFLKKYMFKNV